MRSSLITILTVLASIVLAVPPRHPQGPPRFEKWHQGPPGLEPSATASIPAGILPSSALGAGSTGSPMKLSGKGKKVVSGVAGAFATGNSAAPAATASVSLTSYDKK